jgi:hypothetical protein
MWEVVVGTLLVLVIVLVAISVRGRILASRLEIDKKRIGKTVVPTAEKTKN